MTTTLTSQVSVSTAPVLLVSAQPYGQQVIVLNASGAGVLYIGDKNVTSITGIEVKGNEKLSQGPFELPPETTLYGVSGGGTVSAHVFSIVGN